MRKRVLVAGLLPLVLTVAGACAKSGDGNGVAAVGTPGAPGATPSLSQLEQAVRYTRCMREHGVPMLDPDANGDVHLPDEITDPDYDHAKAFCTEYVRSYSPHP